MSNASVSDISRAIVKKWLDDRGHGGDSILFNLGTPGLECQRLSTDKTI
jgi:hypothetical protein